MNRLIIWFAKNSVAANVLMILILVMGYLSIPNTKKELIPNVSLERIAIQTLYPGASPFEVEKSVCKRIESAIYDIEGMIDLTTQAQKGSCNIQLDVDFGYDTRIILEEVKARVGGVSGFPPEVQRPIIKELKVRNRVATLIISGDAEEWVLKKIASRIRDDLLDSPLISVVDLENVRPYEVSVQVTESSLQQYGLSLSEVATIIKNSSQNMPGGTLNTAAGDVLIQTEGKVETANGFDSIILRSKPDGGRLLLSDLATVVDGFEYGNTHATFNGKPAVSLEIYRVGKQNIVDVAQVIQNYVAEPTSYIPPGISLYIWQDDSKHFEGRTQLLINNALQGLCLLFLTLMLFLHWRVSFWVSVGIPIAFMGAFWFLPNFGGSINVISLFAFILVLGIVVDDAIIVGESVFSQQRSGLTGVDAAITGTKKVSKPITFAVLTTIIAFIPLLYLPGPEGKLMQVIPIVVISTLIFSLVESLLILPAHLAHSRITQAGYENKNTKYQKLFSEGLEKFVERCYRPFLTFVLRWNLAAITAFIAIFIVAISLLTGGWLKMVLFSEIEADVAVASVGFAEGTPAEVTQQAVNKIEQAAILLSQELEEEFGEKQINQILAVIAPRVKTSNANSQNQEHKGRVSIEFVDSEKRKIAGKELLRRWRNLVGDINGALELRFESNLNNPIPDLAINFYGDNLNTLKTVAEDFKSQMIKHRGVYEVRDSLQSGRKQVTIQLLPVARDLGLTLNDLGNQVQQAFHGIEVQSFYRGEDEVKVMVRYPDSARGSLWHLENMHIRLTDGSTTPLLHVAEVTDGTGAPTIQRIDRKRVVTVSAFVDNNITSAAKVMKQLEQSTLTNLSVDYPGVRWGITGKQKSIKEFFASMGQSYSFALIIMYLLMAVLFGSYSQPLMVMYAIPFGIVGSLLGHWITGVDVTLWSFVGMIAVSGVVVNDNLVLVDFINEKRREGVSIIESIKEAGAARFRPIILTSLTTFVGLMPIILETSVQAQFLIPMAVSLSFGVLFATFISLILVPSAYLTLDQLNKAFQRLHHKLRLLFKVHQDWDIDIEQAYEEGFRAGMSNKPLHTPPFKNDVIAASWEAGWNDGYYSRKGLQPEG
ncbi:efflux RND transporter permease subunit [Pleionea sediminis]|uniref:efflux RND transporter permease subunit n=1 Tax=Pleionea sediminis TaxID=2569479 RepID=UPI001184CC5B|nr:efflux RND transporter permease subunit [Pleionea sediminis]